MGPAGTFSRYAGISREFLFSPFLIPRPVLKVTASASTLPANGWPDFDGIVRYFNQMTWIAANEPVCAFDLNGNDRIDFADIVALFSEI